MLIFATNVTSCIETDSAFKQQKLPAWQPILTAGTVLPTFFLIGIAFIPIGFALLMSSNQVKETKIDYTNCHKDNTTTPCSEILTKNIEKGINEKCTCTVEFTLDEDYERDVFVYYGLTNYYQNHRRYVKSRDDKQLLGLLNGAGTDCEPFTYGPAEKGKSKRKPIAPCGAIANSLFNDTFVLERWDNQRNYRQGGHFSLVRIVNTGIAWATDKSAKFRNPREKTLQEAFKNYDKPPNWKVPVYELDNGNPSNNGFQNEALIVWMRNAALPSFRKIYGRIDHTAEKTYHTSLPKGRYRVIIDYHYPVDSFKGTKRFIISNTSWLGGKNPFLGVAYIAVGFICLVLSGVFLFIHKKFGKR
jgi:hypothetical protein